MRFRGCSLRRRQPVVAPSPVLVVAPSLGHAMRAVPNVGLRLPHVRLVTSARDIRDGTILEQGKLVFVRSSAWLQHPDFNEIVWWLDHAARKTGGRSFHEYAVYV